MNVQEENLTVRSERQILNIYGRNAVVWKYLH